MRHYLGPCIPLASELVVSTDVQTTNVLLGQFEKVTRTKSKWKCTLKDGVYTIDGRDVVFSRATGEFQWG